MTDTTNRIVEGERASVALNEYLSPAFAVLRQEYTAKLSDLAATRVMEGEPLKMVQKLSQAIKIIAEVESQVRALVLDGEVAKADVERAGNVARMSAEGQRWAKF